jgi:hypothetical protein
LALAMLMQLAQVRRMEQRRTQYDCAGTKVVVTDKGGHKDAVRVEGHMTLLIDDAAKNVIFSDGRRLRITRFDKFWISGNSEDIEYEFDRADGTLSYAGSTTTDNVTTNVIGSGRCRNVGEKDQSSASPPFSII